MLPVKGDIQYVNDIEDSQTKRASGDDNRCIYKMRYSTLS